MNQNGRSRSSGIIGHDAPEYPVCTIGPVAKGRSRWIHIALELFDAVLSTRLLHFNDDPVAGLRRVREDDDVSRLVVDLAAHLNADFNADPVLVVSKIINQPTNESTLNNRQSLYWRVFKGETGLSELQDIGILMLETLQILTRSEWVRKRV